MGELSRDGIMMISVNSRDGRFLQGSPFPSPDRDGVPLIESSSPQRHPHFVKRSSSIAPPSDAFHGQDSGTDGANQVSMHKTGRASRVLDSDNRSTLFSSVEARRKNDRSALLSSIKACSKSKNLEEGMRIHDEIVTKRIWHEDVYINNALITMYANCGALSKAHNLFAEISSRNVVTWNALICGYAQCGLGEEALKVFGSMEACGEIFPDSITFSCVLKACGITRSAEKGEEIHTEIKKRGLIAKNIILGTSLVDMYARCGMLEKSRGVFDELGERNLVTWNALITGYVQHGFGKEALSCFGRICEEGLSPDVITYTCILKACAMTGLTVKGEEIHAQVAKSQLLRGDTVLCTALIDMYSKCGMLEKARELFHDAVAVRSVIAWNALIGGYVQHGYGHKALDCLSEMRDEGLLPDAFTFASLLRACGSTGSLERGQEIHSEIKKQGLLEHDTILATALVDMYAKCGMFTKALEVFNEHSVWGVTAAWNAMISGYVQHGLAEMALKCFERMKGEHVKPDAITFICLSKACGMIGLVSNAEKIHAEIKMEAISGKNAVDLANSLVDMYAKCGSLEKAQGLFDELPLVRDAGTWNVLMSGYVLHERYDEAIGFFERMQKDGLKPNAFTYACILKACSMLGAIRKGRDIHDAIARVQSSPLQDDLVLCNALIDMYAKCGACAKAREVFDGVGARDVVSWTALMSVYAQHGRTKQVFGLFDEMRSEGIMPTEVTFVVMVIACSHGGLVEEGQACFEAMKKKYGMMPTMEHRSCMLDLFGRAGRFDKAVIQIERVRSCDALELWISLLGICQKWMNVELGRWAFEQSMRLDSKCSAIYVSIRNVYAAAGMQEEADQVEDLRIQNWSNLARTDS